ncbi:MAG: hypothetical protein E6Q88_07670, partial [Lysobacteraceae bacterium]
MPPTRQEVTIVRKGVDQGLAYGVGRVLFVVAAVLAGVTGAHAAAPVAMSNPVDVGGMDAGGIGDPEIIKFRGKYYMYSSNNNYTGGANSDRVLVWESIDLVNWAYKGVAANYANGWMNWAPDVLYHNGQFYMVTSGDSGSGGRPADPYYPALPPYYRDHVVMRSDSPVGPFVKMTDNLPGSIDGHIFQDDDGKLYFFWASGGGIRYRALSAPNTIDSAQAERHLTSCVVNIVGNWTEAPMVWKRNGTYFLSYSGNDLIRDDYQVHVCKGASLESLKPQTNKVLSLDTAGSWVGSAHNTIVTGPDLVTVYNAYHERRSGTGGDGRPAMLRQLALSEAWVASDGQLLADAPDSGFNKPAQPLFRDDFNRTAIGSNWQQYGAAPWGIWGSELLWNDSKGYAGWQLQVTKTTASPADYVYEGMAKHFSWGPLTVSPYPKYGIASSVVRDTLGNITSAFFFGVDARNNLLVSWAVVNGVDQGWQNTSMPAGWNHNVWRTLRIEKRGNTFKLYYDDMLKQTRVINNLHGGAIGVAADNTHVDFSSLAMNPNISGWYRITPRIAPTRSVEVGGWSVVNGGNVIQWTYFGNPNQIW